MPIGDPGVVEECERTYYVADFEEGIHLMDERVYRGCGRGLV